MTVVVLLMTWQDVSIAAFVQANGELTGVPGGVEEAVELSSRLVGGGVPWVVRGEHSAPRPLRPP